MKNISSSSSGSTGSVISTIVSSFDSLDITSGSSGDESGASPRARVTSNETMQPLPRSIHARKSLKLLRSFQENSPTVIKAGDNPIRRPAGVDLNATVFGTDLKQVQRSKPFIQRAFSRRTHQKDAWSSPNQPSRTGACIPTLFKRRPRSGTVSLGEDFTVTEI